MVGVIAAVILAVGVLLIVVGIILTVRRERAVETTPVAEEMSGLVRALAELATALKGYPAGLIMIFLGVLLLLVSAVVGVSGAIAA